MNTLTEIRIEQAIPPWDVLSDHATGYHFQHTAWRCGEYLSATNQETSIMSIKLLSEYIVELGRS